MLIPSSPRVNRCETFGDPARDGDDVIRAVWRRCDYGGMEQTSTRVVYRNRWMTVR